MKLFKKKKNQIVILRLIIAAISAIVGGVVLIYCLPNLLYHSSGCIISECVDQTTEYVYVTDEAEIEFQPQTGYISTVWLYIYDYTNEGAETNPKMQISILNSSGRKICEDYYWVLCNSSYIQIPIGTNVYDKREYKIRIKLPEGVKVSIKTCPEKDTIAEEKLFVHDNTDDGVNSFMKIYYGIYSKKLLLVWCCVFALGSLFLTELIEKENDGNN